MIKDYAKPQASSGAQITPQRGWIALVFLILLMACLSLGVFFMVGKKHRSPSSLLVASAPVVRKAPQTLAVAQPLVKQGLAKSSPNGINYDFYTMLPENQSLPQASTPKGNMVQHQYVLQIASSRNFIEIKKLQRNLGKHGIDTRISSVVSNQTTWYRLESESYTQRSAIDEDLSRLHQMSLAPIIREQKAP